jgi:large subunit ribosomal protein L15
MDLNSLYNPPNPEDAVTRRKRKKRVGRGIGSGHGKTSSRGHKGQYASAGAGKPAFYFEGGQMPLFRRMPKRGFNHTTWDKHYLVVNVGDLNDHFQDGDVVDHAALKKARLANGPCDGIRILGKGSLQRKLTVKACHFSASARAQIEGKGGSCEVLPGRKPPVRNKMKPRKPKNEG